MAKDNNSFVLSIGLILALFLLVGQSFILNDNGSNGDGDRSISVSGKSEMNVAPDLAEIHISIKTENDDAKVAQNENGVLSAKVIDALKGYGISEKDIETQNFRLNENYKYDVVFNNVEDEKSKELKYESVHTLKIKYSDLEKIGDVVDLVIGAGANGVNNIDYTLSDELEAKVRAESLEMAIVAGKAKAGSMSETLGVELGEVKTVLENNYYFSPYSFAANVKAESYDSNGGGSLNYLSPQSVSVQSSVNLEFEIE